MNRLRQILSRIDGKGYPLYKQAKGTFQFSNFNLTIVHVQGDPFAQPSLARLEIPLNEINFRFEEIHKNSRKTGYEDAIIRGVAESFRRFSKIRGSGKSGLWLTAPLGQEMLARTACELEDSKLTIRFRLGLPAEGRRILGKEAQKMLLDELPKVVDDALSSRRHALWRAHTDAYEDQEVLRTHLLDNNLLCFIANGSILPRESGVSEKPLEDNPIPWNSPKELELSVNLPHRGSLKGMALRPGITLICGGGFHGKSTLLNTIAKSIYNHIPGDGRELCITNKDAVMVRSEDGRAVTHVNIAPFIKNLPNGKNTEKFSTENASGSTSQATSIMETLELGSKTILIDEDTSATNFMMRDRRMQELVSSHLEPITPFIDRIAELKDKLQVSTILVVGGSGDYFDVADTVISMESYKPHVRTEDAKTICQKYPDQRLDEKIPMPEIANSRKLPTKIKDLFQSKKRIRKKTSKTRYLAINNDEIDTSLITQLREECQLNTAFDLLQILEKENDNPSMNELCDWLTLKTKGKSLSQLLRTEEHDRSELRPYDFGAILNRIRP